METTRLLTDKTALDRTRIETPALPALAGGEALLAVRRLALTTNNITYAAFGDAMRYWDFFPTGVEGWGHMPAWGFADVVASNAQGVEAGERIYGYFPIASHIVMQPVRVTERGFYDGAPHRAELVSAYNQYTRATSDPAYRADAEDQQALVRPLFITSFVLADFLADNAFFGAKRLVVSSASSKTAYGTAWCLKDAGIELVAVTSESNRAFVERLGLYSRIASYAELETLATDVPTTYVDFSGDEKLRVRIHQHFAGTLVYDCVVGSAQVASPLRETRLTNPKPKFFFAPPQIAKRNSDWGYAEFNRRFGEAQAGFIRFVSDGASPFMKVEQHRGIEAAPAVVASLVAGRSNPATGHVLIL